MGAGIDPDVAAIALASSRRLSGRVGEGLTAEVYELVDGDAYAAKQRFADPTAVASLVVSLATLAWTAYWDLRDKRSSRSDELDAKLAQRVREAAEPGTVAAPDVEAVADAVVAETMRHVRSTAAEDESGGTGAGEENDMT